MTAAKPTKKKPVAAVKDAQAPPETDVTADVNLISDPPAASENTTKMVSEDAVQSVSAEVAPPESAAKTKTASAKTSKSASKETTAKETLKETKETAVKDAPTQTAKKTAKGAAKKAPNDAEPTASVNTPTSEDTNQALPEDTKGTPVKVSKKETKEARPVVSETPRPAVSADLTERTENIPMPVAEPKTSKNTINTSNTSNDAAPKIMEGVTEPTAEIEAPIVQAAAFRALNLSEPTMRGIIEAGFEAPTPIQEQAIPVLLQGHDLIGQAQTGTGKTAAFALPLAEKLDASQNHVQAIILLPTRELCIQVAQETHGLTKYNRLRVVPVYGGQPIDRQFRALMGGPQIVVGTPGRVLDHLRRGTLKLNQVRMVVLDEADEMLNMGFLEDVEEILKEAPKERQTALFSATMPPRIAALAREYLNNPQRVSIESKHRTVALVEQTYYEVIPSQKVEALARILDMESPGSTLIFCRTRRDVDELGEALQLRGYEADTLHGEMNQAARDRVMNRFRASQADLLIATDVAARGLDIDQITHVVNYDIPWDVESYIHRIGRTGRAGRSGNAITLISPRERRQLKLIEKFINAPIKPARVPSAADIATRRREIFKAKLRETLTGGNFDGYLVSVEELAAEGDFDTSQIAAAALQMLWQAQKGASDYDVNEADVEVERTESGMTRLFLQIGRVDGVRPGDIVGAIANEAGLPGNAIGAIDIMDRSTFVEVPDAEAARVMDALGRTKLRGKRVYVDIARPRTEGDTGQGGGPNRGFNGGGPGGFQDNRGPRDDRPNRDGDNRFDRPGNGREDHYARTTFRPHRPENRNDDNNGRRFRRNG